MIKSGLTNVQKAGYLGYPHERDGNPRDRMERPFVALGDSTVMRKSDFSDPMAIKAITPAPVMYNDIFAKRTTADERLYILRQIQQGLDKIQRGILSKGGVQAPQMPLPTQPGGIPPPPGNPSQPGAPQPPTMPGAFPPPPGGMDLPPPLIAGTDATSSGPPPLEEAEEAQDVVANPPPQNSAAEVDRALQQWLHMQHLNQYRQIEGRPFNRVPDDDLQALRERFATIIGDEVLPDFPQAPTGPISEASSISFPSVPFNAKYQNDALKEFQKVRQLPLSQRADAINVYQPKDQALIRAMFELEAKGFPINMSTIDLLNGVPGDAESLRVKEVVQSNGVGPRYRGRSDRFRFYRKTEMYNTDDKRKAMKKKKVVLQVAKDARISKRERKVVDIENFVTKEGKPKYIMRKAKKALKKQTNEMDVDGPQSLATLAALAIPTKPQKKKGVKKSTGNI